MRVLYFSRDYSPHDHRFLSSLAENGHQAYSLRLEKDLRQVEDRPLPPAVQSIQWKGGKKAVRWLDYPSLRNDLKRVIQQIQPDVIHAGPVQRVAFLAALTGFRPLVTMSWGSDLLKDADLNGWMRQVTRYTLQHTTVMVGDCLAVKRKAADFGFPEEKVVLFPWGVDLDQFCPGDDGGLRSRLGWQDAFIVLSLRAWEPLYGVDVVVRAFVQAAGQMANLRLLLLGGGSQAAVLHEILARAGMSDRVYFGGQVANLDLPRYYRAADLYLSASHSDGSSVSLLEALACGNPVLVSDIPGNREWITPDHQGWLFKDGNDQALADGILKAARAQEGLRAVGVSARRLAEERADWRRNFRRLEDAYEMAVRWTGAG